jgi:hypothetical protein
MNDLVIDGSNFATYFFDVRKHGPKPGQIMARYLAKAELISGEDKGYLIDLLVTNPLGAEMSVRMMQTMFASQEADSIRVCKEIATDLMNGMSKNQVLEKPYVYTLEKFYWTKEDYVPKGDPHWQIIKVTILNQSEKNKEEE